MLIDRKSIELNLRDYVSGHERDYDIGHAVDTIIDETYGAIDTCADVWGGALSEAALNSMLYHPGMVVDTIDWWSTDYINDVLQACEVRHEEE